MPVERPDIKFALCACAAALAASGSVLLAGCGGGASRSPATQMTDTSRPVQLGRGTTQGASVLRSLDEPLVRRAIENYRINKKRAAGPYKLVGADLNEDGRPEAVVLFEGKDWCAGTGCSLAILQSGPHGYRPISRTVRVKAPVVISAERSNGWRDLFVSSGGAGTAPLRRVRLRFTGNGYPRNAMLEEEIPPDIPQTGDIAIAAPSAQGARSGPQPRASNR